MAQEMTTVEISLRQSPGEQFRPNQTFRAGSIENRFPISQFQIVVSCFQMSLCSYLRILNEWSSKVKPSKITSIDI
jgi:hypothetical protein